MQNLEIVEKENVETMLSIDLAKAFKQTPNKVNERLLKIYRKEENSLLVCEQRDYENRGKKEPTLEICMSLAMLFAGTSRKQNAPELLMQLMMKHLDNSKTIQTLKAENAKLKLAAESNTIKVFHQKGIPMRTSDQHIGLSATVLLKQHGVKIKTQSFFQMAKAHGVTSQHYVSKSVNTIVDGKYGINEEGKNKTPMFFQDQFRELLIEMGLIE